VCAAGAFARVLNDKPTDSQGTFSNTINTESRSRDTRDRAVEDAISPAPITCDCVANNLQYVFDAVENEDAATLEDDEHAMFVPGQTHESTSALASGVALERQVMKDDAAEPVVQRPVEKGEVKCGDPATMGDSGESRGSVTRASEVYCHGDEGEAKLGLGSLNSIHWLHRRNSSHALHGTPSGDGEAHAARDASAGAADGAGEHTGSLKGFLAHLHHKKESAVSEGEHASGTETGECGDGARRRSSFRGRLARLHDGHKHEDAGLTVGMEGELGAGEEGRKPLHRRNSLRALLPGVCGGGNVAEAEAVDAKPRAEEVGSEPLYRRNSVEDFVARHWHPHRRPSDGHHAQEAASDVAY